MDTTTQVTEKHISIGAVAGALLAVLLLAALVLVRLAGSGDAEQRAAATEAPTADQLGGSAVAVNEKVAVATGQADAGPSRSGDDHRLIPPTSIVSTPHTVVDDDPGVPPVHEDPFPRDPRNTPARWEIVVTPAQPVVGDEVTVEIFWSDDEADTVVAESWCHPGSGGRPGLCADDMLMPPCGALVDPAVEPRPGGGVLRFTFTPSAPGSFGWDHGVVIRSIPADLHDDCTAYDPWQDVVFASGTIDVAPAPNGDVVDPPVVLAPREPHAG